MNEEVRVQTTEEGEGNNTLNSERPEWLPEKFESGEALAKSYAELEKKMSTEQSTEERHKMQKVKLSKQLVYH